ETNVGRPERGDGAGRSRPAGEGNGVSRGQRLERLRLLHREPQRGRPQGRNERSDVRRADGGDRHGERDEPAGAGLSRADRQGVRVKMISEAEYTSPDGALRFLVTIPDGDITMGFAR